MFANVGENNFHNLRLQLNREEYWDFMLDKTPYRGCSSLANECIISYIDVDDPDCIYFDEIYSKRNFSWKDAISNGITLYNIGYTGMDNGLIQFEKDRITNEQFLHLYTGSTHSIEKDDKRLILRKVSGNTMVYDYPVSTIYENDFQSVKLNGGFYQGFFKLYGYDYQVLPTVIADNWTLQFTLKKEDFEREAKRKILNDVYPENKGIFFYMGTRAENKWFTLYNKSDKETFETINRNYYTDGTYFEEDYETSNDEITNNVSYIQNGEMYKDEPVEPYIVDGYLCDSCYEDDDNSSIPVQTDTIESFYQYTEKNNKNNCNKKCRLVPNPYWLNYYFSMYDCGDYQGNNNKNNCNPCDCNSYLNTCCCDICDNDSNCGKTFVGTTGYFTDDYLENNSYVDLRKNNNYTLDDYFKDDIPIDENMELNTKDGYPLDQTNFYEIRTNNKFITFNRTPTGFTTEDFDENIEIVFTGQTLNTKEIPNYFTLFDRTPTGFTTDTIGNLIKKYNNTYKVYDDIRGNAFALQIKDDGSIGYKYLVLDCDKENRFDILEEYSLPNIIKNGEWVTITVRLKMNPYIDDIKCYKHMGKRKMKLYFYINGKLKFISKEIPELNFRELKDLKEKQEGVPFNISLGGGTQGLCDMITLNYHKLPEYILPLEKNFAGSFIGEMRSFKFFDCFEYEIVKG